MPCKKYHCCTPAFQLLNLCFPLQPIIATAIALARLPSRRLCAHQQIRCRYDYPILYFYRFPSHDLIPRPNSNGRPHCDPEASLRWSIHHRTPHALLCQPIRNPLLAHRCIWRSDCRTRQSPGTRCRERVCCCRGSSLIELRDSISLYAQSCRFIQMDCILFATGWTKLLKWYAGAYSYDIHEYERQ